jgi:hypothetical protein
MPRQIIVSIALLFATVPATTSSAQSVLDQVVASQVVANLRDIRAARANTKIQSRLLPPRPQRRRLADSSPRRRRSRPTGACTCTWIAHRSVRTS